MLNLIHMKKTSGSQHSGNLDYTIAPLHSPMTYFQKWHVRPKRDSNPGSESNLYLNLRYQCLRPHGIMFTLKLL